MQMSCCSPVPAQSRVTSPTMYFLLLCCLLSPTHSQTVFDPVPHREHQRYDGWYNNLNRLNYGATNTPFIYKATPQYEDSVRAPAKRPQDAGLLSLEFMKGEDGLASTRDLTALFAFFGQFVSGEILSSISSGNVACPVEPMPLRIYERRCDDRNVSVCPRTSRTVPFFRVDFDRTTGKGVNNPRKPLNHVTAWIDGSFIYGIDDSTANAVRSYQHGQLLVDGGLPALNDANAPLLNMPMPHGHPEVESPKRLFLLAGAKSNQNIPLLSIAMVWHLYHNSVAARLEQLNPVAHDEEVYERARRWVIAVQQNIIMYEYVPALIGLAGLNETFPEYKGYNPSVDPSISVEFQAAAFRIGHSAIPSGFYTLNHTSTDCNFDSIPLCSHWWDANKLFRNGDLQIEAVLLGLIAQRAERTDHKLSAALTDYNTVREAFGLPRVEQWSKIGGDGATTEILTQLQRFYKSNSPDNADLYLVGLLESVKDRPGETFRAILIDQFARLRDGDRFWFENRNEQHRLFSDDEILSIRSIRFRDVIANATQIDASDLPENVFEQLHSRCPQPRQLSIRDFPAGVCGRNQQYDFFTDSEVPFVISFLALTMIPFICAGIGWFFARSREQHLSRMRRRNVAPVSVKTRATCRMLDSYPALEYTSVTVQRKVQLHFVTQQPQITVLSRTGKPLRTVTLKTGVSIHLSTDLRGESLLLVALPYSEYDLVTAFPTSEERGIFHDQLHRCLMDFSITAEDHLCSRAKLLSMAVTHAHRMRVVHLFFQTAFNQAFRARQKATRKLLSASSPTFRHQTPLRFRKLMKVELNKQEFTEVLKLKPDSLFVEQMFALADADRNGSISYPEFIDLLVLMSKGSLEVKMKMLFHMYDIDGSDDLDTEEFTLMVRSLVEVANKDCSSENIEAITRNMLGECDMNDGRRLRFEDFYRLIQTHQPNLLNNFSFRQQVVKSQHSQVHPKTPTLITSGKFGFDLPNSTMNESFDLLTHTDGESSIVDRCCAAYRRVVYMTENYWSHIVLTVIFVGVTLCLFAGMFVRYALFNEHSGVRHIAGFYPALSRGSAAALSFTSAITLLTVCRNLMTQLRDTALGYYIPFDSAITLHRYSAWATLLFSVTHTIGHAVNFYQIGTQPPMVLRCILPEYYIPSDSMPKFVHWAFTTVPGITGLLLVVVMSVMFVFATSTARHHIFKAFWATHRLYPVFFALTFVHGSFRFLQEPFYYCFLLGPIVLYTIDTIISFRQRAIEMKIEKVDLLPSDVLHLSFKLPTSFRYSSGQWIRMACDRLSRSEFHPFTICSAPHEKTLDTYIRCVGPWTRRLREDFERCMFDKTAYPKIHVDGPYGSTHQDWYKFEVVVLVGAGIGVTPTASVLKDLVYKVYQQHSEIATRNVYFIWLARNHIQFEWFTDLLKDIEAKDTEHVIGMDVFITQLVKDFDIRTMMMFFQYICEHHFQRISSRSLFTGLRAKTHFGRIHFEQYLRGIQVAHPQASKVGIFSCGPKSVVRSVDAACKVINRENVGPVIIPHQEVF